MLQTNGVGHEIKRHLGQAREYYREIFFMLKVETLDDAQVVLKSMIKEQNVSVNQSNEIKNLKKLLDEVEADKTLYK